MTPFRCVTRHPEPYCVRPLSETRNMTVVTRGGACAQAESRGETAVSMQRATAIRRLLLSRELAASSPSTRRSYCEVRRDADGIEVMQDQPAVAADSKQRRMADGLVLLAT
jgi:hypothetical protein